MQMTPTRWHMREPWISAFHFGPIQTTFTSCFNGFLRVSGDLWVHPVREGPCDYWQRWRSVLVERWRFLESSVEQLALLSSKQLHLAPHVTRLDGDQQFLVGWLASQLLASRPLAGWVVGWLGGWLVGWLAGWRFFRRMFKLQLSTVIGLLVTSRLLALLAIDNRSCWFL